MVGFKKFMAMWLSMVVFISVFSASMLVWLYPEGETPEVKELGFSVHWMGFFPSYGNQYPEYYICVNNLKSDILTMDIALQIKNQEDAGYYFKGDEYEAPPAGWTISPLEIGYVDIDVTRTFTYSVFRSKPTSISQGRLTETINLVIGAYYDAGYSNLYSQDNFTVTFNFIDRTSSAWTLLYHDNFDGGTWQGWTGGATSTDYYRSFPYSLRLTSYSGGGDFEKTFNVGTGQEAYLIFSMRSTSWGAGMPRVDLDDVMCFSPDVNPSSHTWYQFTIPLPLGETTVEIYIQPSGGFNAYLDDVFVIAK